MPGRLCNRRRGPVLSEVDYMPGPAPKPTALKVIEGNPGKQKLNAKEPKPTSGKPSCPKWLDERARAEWKRVINELDALGLVAKIDRGVLAGYCYWFARWREAAEFLEENGDSYVMKDESGKIKYVAQFPQVAIARDAFRMMRQCALDFGMTPAARSKIEVPWDKGDEWEWLQKRKK